MAFIFAMGGKRRATRGIVRLAARQRLEGFVQAQCDAGRLGRAASLRSAVGTTSSARALTALMRSCGRPGLALLHAA